MKLILGALNLRLSSAVTGPADGTNADYPFASLDNCLCRLSTTQPPRQATARTGQLPTRRDGSFCSSDDDLTCARPCSETGQIPLTPENETVPLNKRSLSR